MSGDSQLPTSALIRQANQLEGADGKRRFKDKYRRQKNLEEQRRASQAPAMGDVETGRDINSHISKFTEKTPSSEPTLKVQDNDDDDDDNDSDDNDNDDDDNDSDDDDDMAAFDEYVEGMERLNFDFEAYPPDNGDIEGILDLITQIFLRANVNCEELAKRVVENSPFGCVFKPAEENEDEEIGSLVYGVLSVIDLRSEEKSIRDLRDFLLQRAEKHSVKEVVKELADELNGLSRLGMLVNERMIHFPAQIAGPAFRSLREELTSLPKKKRYDEFIMIVKIRVGDVKNNNEMTNDAGGDGKTKKKKKLGKAAKKRLAAERIANADVIFDNAEEELLFQGEDTPLYFQYPVESDVEKSSKFHATVRNGVTYRPYRRVCLLTAAQFDAFSQRVQAAFS